MTIPPTTFAKFRVPFHEWRLEGKIKEYDSDGNIVTTITKTDLEQLEVRSGDLLDVAIVESLGGVTAVGSNKVAHLRAFDNDSLSTLKNGQWFSAVDSQGFLDVGIYGHRLEEETYSPHWQDGFGHLEAGTRIHVTHSEGERRA